MEILYFVDKIIYLSCCNEESMDTVPERIIKKYSKKTFAKWNETLVKKNIKKVESFLSKEMTYETYVNINLKLHSVLTTYHNNKKLYVRVINLIKKYFSKYGYASFFNLNQKDFDMFDRRTVDLQGDFCNIQEISDMTVLDSWADPCSTTFHACNIHDDDFVSKGFIPNLYFSENKDLILRFIDEVYNPARENYLIVSEFMTQCDISYVQTVKGVDDNINSLKCINMINDFLSTENMIKNVK